jgi:hypothetical protein
MNLRNPDMLLDLMKAHAVLMQNQRERDGSGNIVIINAVRTSGVPAGSIQPRDRSITAVQTDQKRV